MPLLDNLLAIGCDIYHFRPFFLPFVVAPRTRIASYFVNRSQRVMYHIIIEYETA